MFRRNHYTKFALVLLTVSAASSLASNVALGQSPESKNTAAADGQSDARDTPTVAAEGDKSGLDKEAEKAKLRSSAMAGLLVLSLICIVFLVLIVLVALWARRIRLMTQQPLPEQHPGDPLWYLRKGNQSDSTDIAKVADSGSPRDDP